MVTSTEGKHLDNVGQKAPIKGGAAVSILKRSMADSVIIRNKLELIDEELVMQLGSEEALRPCAPKPRQRTDGLRHTSRTCRLAKTVWPRSMNHLPTTSSSLAVVLAQPCLPAVARARRRRSLGPPRRPLSARGP
jgi:hypothetical protein